MVEGKIESGTGFRGRELGGNGFQSELKGMTFEEQLRLTKKVLPAKAGDGGSSQLEKQDYLPRTEQETIAGLIKTQDSEGRAKILRQYLGQSADSKLAQHLFPELQPAVRGVELNGTGTVDLTDPSKPSFKLSSQFDELSESMVREARAGTISGKDIERMLSLSVKTSHDSARLLEGALAAMSLPFATRDREGHKEDSIFRIVNKTDVQEMTMVLQNLRRVAEKIGKPDANVHTVLGDLHPPIANTTNATNLRTMINAGEKYVLPALRRVLENVNVN